MTQETASQQKVIVTVSHSDGITPFLNVFAPEAASQITKFEYCCTLAVELFAIRGQDETLNLGLGNLTVIHN